MSVRGQLFRALNYGERIHVFHGSHATGGFCLVKQLYSLAATPTSALSRMGSKVAPKYGIQAEMQQHLTNSSRGLLLREYCLRSESKTCQDGEDWASDRKSAKSEAEARVRKLSRESTVAAGENNKMCSDYSTRGDGCPYTSHLKTRA